MPVDAGGMRVRLVRGRAACPAAPGDGPVRLAVARGMAGRYTVLQNLKGTYSIKGRTIYK